MQLEYIYWLIWKAWRFQRGNQNPSIRQNNGQPKKAQIQSKQNIPKIIYTG